jgi:predicted amidohydrolase YtcJ
MAFGAQAVGANLLASPDGAVETVEDLVAELRQWADENPEDIDRTGWIYGIGYDDAILGRHPTRDDLDQVSTELPIMVIHISGHFGAVNSLGLEAIGYDAGTPDPEGGIIRRRPGGTEPNGVLEELAAMPKFGLVLNPATAEDQRYFLEQGLEMAKSFGYTTAQEGRAMGPTHGTLAAAAEAGLLDIDVVSYIDYMYRDQIEGPWHSRDYTDGYRVGGLKITLDGSPQGRTAWRNEPYLLPPDGQDQGYAGYPAIPADSVVEGLLREAYEKGWQTLVHANGDAAVDQLLRTIRPAHEAAGSPEDRRHTLIHGQYVRMDQLDEMADLDMIASLFPMHTFYWGDWHGEIIGREKAQHISPMRSAMERGVVATSHTDAPVALPNLMQVMWATVNRVSRSGAVIGPEERLTPLEALKTFTLLGAYQHFEEDRKGSIEVGKLADLVILSDNPLTVDPMEINQIVVMETIKEGKTVWSRRGAPGG